MPAKSRVKHSIAASLSYGVVPASLVAEYEGLHAQVHVNPGRPVICICGAFSLPAAPLLVRLHPNPKKNMREFNGGHVPVIGTKVADANQNDLLAVEVSQPEESVWLVRPQQELPAGEYALMIGTRNVSIYPFTVSPVSREVATPTAAKF